MTGFDLALFVVRGVELDADVGPPLSDDIDHDAVVGLEDIAVLVAFPEATPDDLYAGVRTSGP